MGLIMQIAFIPMLISRGFSGLSNLFNQSWFFSNILDYPYYREFYNTFNSNKTIIQFYMFSIRVTEFFTALLFLDFYLSIRNPFYPRKKRYPTYFAAYLIFAVVSEIYIHVEFEGNKNHNDTKRI